MVGVQDSSLCYRYDGSIGVMTEQKGMYVVRLVGR